MTRLSWNTIRHLQLLRVTMKSIPYPLVKIFLLGMLGALAACGGGGGGGDGDSGSREGNTGGSTENYASSSSSSGGITPPPTPPETPGQTLGSCFSMKAGVKFITSQTEPSSTSPTVQWKIEVLDDTFEGKTTIATHRHIYIAEPPMNIAIRDEYQITAAGLERLGSYDYNLEGIVATSTPQAKTSFSPPIVLPGNLQVGQSATGATTVTWTSLASPQTSTRSAYSKSVSFLAIEDVALANGTVIKNACKTRETFLTSSNPADIGIYNTVWYAAGWGIIKTEAFNAKGELKNTSLISQVVTAP
jgi:hypothetical protein